MRDHTHHIELTRQNAVQALIDHCDFHPAAEEVSIYEACGRILAADMYSLITLPNTLNCRLDSVAVHWSDFEDGIPDTSDWKRGDQWEFANTGVAMPDGFDTAVVVENVEIDDKTGSIRFFSAPSAKFAGTSPAGSRLKEGQLLVEAGCKLTPLLIAHITGGGHVTIPVLAKPRIAFIPTGNELVAPTSNVPRGKNIDSNSVLFKSKIEAWGGIPLMYDIVPDDPAALKRTILDSVEAADIVVLNAGSSKGNEDWTMEILEELGDVFCHETNHGPGHHSSMSLVDATPIVGISGPPMGAAFTADFYLKPIVDCYFGQNPEPITLKARLTTDFEGVSHDEKGAVAHAPHGEDRPRDYRTAENPFFSVWHVFLSQGDDGCLEATPSSHRPGPVEANGTHAYFAMASYRGSTPPHAGDFIEVELRA